MPTVVAEDVLIENPQGLRQPQKKRKRGLLRKLRSGSVNLRHGSDRKN